MNAYVLTARDAQRRSTAAAARLLALGALPGDRVTITVPGPELSPRDAAAAQAGVVCLVLGALRAGLIPAMINPLLTAGEMRKYADDVAATWTVGRAEEVQELTDPLGTPTVRAELADVPLGRAMHFTSGTTGRSKGVTGGVLSEDAARAYWEDEHAQWPVEPGDRVLAHGPLAHSAPLRFALLAALHGAESLFVGPFDVERTSKAMVEQRPTVAMAAPTHLQRLLDQPGGAPPSSYRLLAHAGSACPPDLKRRIHAWAGLDAVWEFLGSTEGQFTACRASEWEERPGTLGRARVGRTLVIDDGSLRSDGLIWCATPEFAQFEYFGDPEKTADAWRDTSAGPAFTVGDLGRLDDDGYLFLHGRRTDLIVTGGVNVYPAEVEAELRYCPGVADVAVYGETDPRWGERVCAAVVGDATADEVRMWAAEHVAGYRRPKIIRSVPELPLTATAKVRREGLAEWVAGHAQDWVVTGE